VHDKTIERTMTEPVVQVYWNYHGPSER